MDQIKSLKKRMLFLTLFILCVILVVSNSMYNVTKSIESSVEIYKQKAVNSKMLISSIEKDLNYISRCSRDIMLGSDYYINLEKIKQKIDQINKSFKLIGSLYIEKDHKEHMEYLAKAEKKTMDFVFGVEKKMEGLKDILPSKRIEVYNQYKKELTPLAMESRKYFSQIRDMKEKDFKDISSKLDQNISYEKNFIIIVNIVVSIIALITMVFIYFILKKQLKTQSEFQNINKILSKYVIYSKTNLKGIITEVSDAFCQISGYEREELIGKPHNIIRHPNTCSSTFEHMWETIKNDQVWEGEVENLAKNKSSYWVHANVSPQYDDNGNKIGYVAIRYDITASKNFEKQNLQLLQSEKMASLGEMIGNIAHQWRQPLSAITSNASSIKLEQMMGIIGEDLGNKMDSIIDKTNYLSDTINTFRDFIKGEKVYKEIVLQDEINQALSIVNSVIYDNQITLYNHLDNDDKIELTMVSGELPQVIINIINNAKDILVEKEIEEPWIKIKLKRKDNKAIISLEDNGGGIPDNIMPRIFEPYFTTKHQSQGTGLGLHMSYKIIVESLKGQMYVKNTDNGAKFYIELPIHS